LLSHSQPKGARHVQRLSVALLVLSIIALFGTAWAQSPTAAGTGFEKKEFTYEDFAKGRFSDVVTVTGPGKLIFLSGTGAWDEATGAPLFKDNFMEQCRYSYGVVEKRLAAQGATMNDVVRQTAYIVDVRNQADYGKCRAEAFQGAALPASTGICVAALGVPYMLFEVEVTAAVAR
jgi:2-iminobutanoate/2-iminopropanoate deaminase